MFIFVFDFHAAFPGPSATHVTPRVSKGGATRNDKGKEGAWFN